MVLRKGKKPEALVNRILELTTDEGDEALDFFAGSGTLPTVAQKAGRVWTAVEAADYFDAKPLTLMKNVLFGEERGVSKDHGWKGGGAFKYIRLETYEDALSNLEFERSGSPESLLASSESDFREQLR